MDPRGRDPLSGGDGAKARARTRRRAAPLAAAAAALALASCLVGTERAARPPEHFPTETAGLPEARAPRTLDLGDGNTLTLEAAPVRKRLAGRDVRLLAFDGSVPGPLLRVRQGATLHVRLRNRLGLPAAFHAHGVRSGAGGDPGAGAVADGGEGEYLLSFPDAGTFWYRSPVRADYTQPSGLYGSIVVVPEGGGCLGPVDREVSLVLGDLLVDSAGAAPFRRDHADHAVMGRFGNVILVNGDTAFGLEVRRKEYVRFHVANASSARVFNLLLTRTFLKIVGAGSGPYERSTLAASELLGPGERAVFEAAFDDSGTVELAHESPLGVRVLGRIRVTGDSTDSRLGEARYGAEDTCRPLVAEVAGLRARTGGAPDRELLLTGRMGSMDGGGGGAAAAKAGREAHDPGTPEGIEWEDHMGGMNARATPAQMEWVLRDPATGLENGDIRWTFRRGDHVLIRVSSDRWSAHGMPHPIHVHGQRFLVLSVDGNPNGNLAWKDTFLLGMGATAELLLAADAPGEWLLQCQIPEHLEAGMGLRFRVE